MVNTAVYRRVGSQNYASRRSGAGMAMDDYIRDIAQIPLLSAAEERELAIRVQAGDVAARERLIRSNLRLVINIARGFAGRGLDLADLIAEGNLGLLRAVEGFRPDMHTRFSTYGTYWIRQSIQRGLIYTGKSVRIPAYLVQLLSKWRRATNLLQEKLRRPPTEDEVAKSLKLTRRQLALVKKGIQTHTTSPHTEAGHTGRGLEEVIHDPDVGSVEGKLASHEETQRALRLMEQLDPRWARVLRLRFGLEGEQPRTLKEIGEQLGLTRERVRQIETKALQRLNEELSPANA